MRSSEQKWGDNPGRMFVPEEDAKALANRYLRCGIIIGMFIGGLVGAATNGFLRWMGY